MVSIPYQRERAFQVTWEGDDLPKVAEMVSIPYEWESAFQASTSAILRAAIKSFNSLPTGKRIHVKTSKKSTQAFLDAQDRNRVVVEDLNTGIRIEVCGSAREIDAYTAGVKKELTR